MGLFSKLFSREGEDPTQSEGQDAQAAASGGEGVTKSEESVAGGAGAKDARARTAAAPDKAEPATPAAAGDKSARGRAETPPTGAAAKPPPAEPAKGAGTAGQARKPDPGKPVVAAKPPAALGSGISGRSPGTPPAAAESSDAHKSVSVVRKPGVQVRPAPEQIKGGKKAPPPAAGPVA
jgi:hypothetical protein